MNIRDVIIACDPGGHGAFAVMVDGNLVDVDDMPSFTLTIGGHNRVRVDAFTVDTLLRSYLKSHAGIVDRVTFVIEEVGARPKEGPQGAFTFGQAEGLVRGVAVGLGVRVAQVTPAVWKRALKLKKGKDASRLKAQELFPNFRAEFARVKDDGRAEAALIAHYQYLQHRGLGE